MRSSVWMKLRIMALRRGGRRCYICKKKYDLTVHHLQYGERLGEETLRDLCVLCWPCHKKLHEDKRALKEFSDWVLAKRSKKKRRKRKKKDGLRWA